MPIASENTPRTETPRTEAELRCIRAAREKCRILYEGMRTPHRSCGIALAETFNLPTAPYQGLRGGGVTGNGQCGSIGAGMLILGQLFGDPDPTGGVTPALRAALVNYDRLWRERAELGRASAGEISCNALTGQFAAFGSPARASFCTALASEVAAIVAEIVLDQGGTVEVTPIPGVADFDPEHPQSAT